MTAFLSLFAALIVGASDFGGGVASREASPFRVSARVQAASFATMAVAVWLVSAPSVTMTDLVAGAIAGVASAFAFVALYAAFSQGQISLLAPTAAIVGAVVPTLVGALRGESVGGLQFGGIVVALVAIALVAQEAVDEDGERTTPVSAVVLALLAGLGFSIFFLALAETNGDAGLWPLISARAVSVPVISVVAFIVTKGIALPRRPAHISFGAGCAEAVSSVLILWAYQRGPLAVAAVLGAFYPVSSVLLARLVLHERLQRVQLVGVTLALGSIPLVAA